MLRIPGYNCRKAIADELEKFLGSGIEVKALSGANDHKIRVGGKMMDCVEAMEIICGEKTLEEV